MRCGTFFDIPKHWRMNCIDLWAALWFCSVFYTELLSAPESLAADLCSADGYYCASNDARMRRRRARDGSQSLDPGSRVSGFVFFPRTDLVVRPGQTTVPDPSRAHVGGSQPRRRESFELCTGEKVQALRRALRDNYNPAASPAAQKTLQIATAAAPRSFTLYRRQ